jgi:hypothetical protein
VSILDGTMEMERRSPHAGQLRSVTYRRCLPAVSARIGAAPRMTIYGNQLEVMMALAVASPSQDLATRGTYAIGVLVAETFS